MGTQKSVTDQLSTKQISPFLTRSILSERDDANSELASSVVTQWVRWKPGHLEQRYGESPDTLEQRYGESPDTLEQRYGESPDAFRTTLLWIHVTYVEGFQLFCVNPDGCHVWGRKFSLFPEHLISLPLGSSWFHPFIIYTLHNLSVYGLCLRINDSVCHMRLLNRRIKKLKYLYWVYKPL